MSALGFKARWIPFACFLACVILRFTSGATPAECRIFVNFKIEDLSSFCEQLGYGIKLMDHKTKISGCVWNVKFKL